MAEEAQKGDRQKTAELMKIKEENVACFGNMKSTEPLLLLASENRNVNLVRTYTPIVIITNAT